MSPFLRLFLLAAPALVACAGAALPPTVPPLPPRPDATALIAAPDPASPPIKVIAKEAESGIHQVDATHYVIDSSKVDVHTVLQQVSVAPERDNGRLVGLRLERVSPGSTPSNLGLRTGDIVRQVNDIVIDSQEAARDARQEVGRATTLVVHLERGGDTMELHYRIE